MAGSTGGSDPVESGDTTEVFALTRRPRTPPVSTRGDVPVPRETLLARARDALGRTVRVPQGDPRSELAELDDLVVIGRTREVGVHAQLLRHALAGHLAVAASRTPATDAGPGPDRVEELFDELLATVAEHGLSLFGIDAHALVARRALLIDDEESALAAVSTALSHLDEPVVVDHAPTAREHRHNLCATHRLVAGTLVSLGMHEPARALLERARLLADQIRDRVGVAACDHELVRVHASWALRLERAGRDAEEHLRTAARAAAELATGDAELLGADHAPLLRAATILGRPATGPDTADDARRTAERDLAALERCGGHHPSLHDQLVVELARARALERVGDPAGAATVLERVRASRPRGERSLLLSVTRELSRLGSPEVGGSPTPADDSTPVALRTYTDELEAELWSLHQARVLSLRARVAHDRLRREHGQVAAQALSDPLTGLPNRRALDEVLRRLVGTGVPDAAVPPAVAMVDVDGFKRVNDALSHARGDEVLRLVAGALRGSLRADDVVARYGGDEFVVVLPATRPHDAGAALARAVRTVAGLAGEAEGVTLSIGVVAARPPEDPRSVLARADAVMYGVKRDGGDGVRLVAAPGTPAVAVDPALVPDADVLGDRRGPGPSGPFAGAVAGFPGDLSGFRVPRGTPDPTSPAGEPRTRK